MSTALATPVPAAGRESVAVAAAAKPTFAHRLRRSWRRNGAGYLFLTPWLLGFFGLTLGPALASL